MSSKTKLLLVAAVFALSTGKAAAATPSPLTVEAAVEQALAANAGLAAAQAQARADTHRPPQAGALPDPVLSLNVLNMPVDTFDLTREPMTQIQIGISQGVPFPGKRALRRDAAQSDARAVTAQADETRLELIRDVRQTWWNLFYLDRALEVVMRNQDLLRQFITVAQTKYRVGRGLQQDILLGELELSKLLDLELQFQRQRRAWEARLNALLNRSIETTVRLPHKVSEALPDVGTETDLLAMADGLRPRLITMQHRIDAAETRRELARKELLPDFKLGAAYGVRQGDNPTGGDRPDFASVMFSLNLPVYAGKKQYKAIDQRTSELQRSVFMLQDVRRQIHAAISASLTEYTKTREQAALFKQGIIPQARQTVSSMLAGFQVGKVDFLNLINAQLTLYNYQIQYWKTLSQANQALARLAAAVGKESIHE